MQLQKQQNKNDKIKSNNKNNNSKTDIHMKKSLKLSNSMNIQQEQDDNVEHKSDNYILARWSLEMVLVLKQQQQHREGAWRTCWLPYSTDSSCLDL